MERDPVAVELDEQVDRRLAFLDPMGRVLVSGQPVGQGRQALGEVEQELDPFLPVGTAQIGDDRVECAGMTFLGSVGASRSCRGSGPLGDRGSDEVAPLAPGAVVVPDLGVSEQVGQDKPGQARPLADPAVGDDVVVGLSPTSSS